MIILLLKYNLHTFSHEQAKKQSMNQSKTIGQFLEQSGMRFQIFDIGRRICRIPATRFQQFEKCALAYPQPSQRQAWIGILGWDPNDKNKHFIWFLKLPLDESACMVPAGRDDFLHRLLGTIGSSRAPETQNALHDNPYGFTPNQERMAYFHAMTLKTLGKPPSKYYRSAQSYFAKDSDHSQWAELGLQGIADIAVRLDEKNNGSDLAATIPYIPTEPFTALCHLLENRAIGTNITEAIIKRINNQLEKQKPDMQIVTSGLRGISFAKASGLRKRLLQKILSHRSAHNIEVLITIAGRCWNDLHSPELGRPYIEALAHEKVGQDIFSHIMSDLLYIPGMRTPLLQVLRDPKRSAQIEKAAAMMFGR